MNHQIPLSQSASPIHRRLNWRLMIALLMLSIVIIMPIAVAKESRLSIDSIKINEQGGVTIMSDIIMSPEQGEMLENGIPLIFNYHILLREKNRFGFWQTRFEQKIPLELKYHALSKQYVVHDRRYESLKSFPTLSLALTHIGSLRGLSMVTEAEWKSLDDRYCFQGVASLKLDIEALPAPLRIPAYLSKKWRLNSGRTKFIWRRNHEEC